MVEKTQHQEVEAAHQSILRQVNEAELEKSRPTHSHPLCPVRVYLKHSIPSLCHQLKTNVQTPKSMEEILRLIPYTIRDNLILTNTQRD